MSYFWNFNHLTGFEQLLVIVCVIGYFWGVYQIYMTNERL